MRLLLEILLFFLLYQLVVKVIVPLINGSGNKPSGGRTHRREYMHDDTRENIRRTKNTEMKTRTKDYGDYIDYEEVKKNK